jgi:hypothetical protein
MVTYYRVTTTLVTLGITLGLFVRGVGCNNLNYNIKLVCESCYLVNSLGYLVCVLTYSNLMFCIYTVPRRGVITML